MGANMDRYSTLRKILPGFLSNGFAIAALAAALILLPAAAPPAFAADDAPSAADQNCLGCHGSAGMEKKLADGDTLQLHVPADAFVKSVHGANGCTSCHSDVDPAKHPPEKERDRERAQLCGRHDPGMPHLPCRQVRAMGEQHSRRAGAQRQSGGARSAPTVTIRMRSSRTRRPRSSRFPARSATPIFTPPISAACTRNRGIGSKDSYAPICSGCHSAHAVKPILAWPGTGGGLFRLSCRRAGIPPEMAAQCRLAFRGRVLPGLPRARRATQSRSHADRQHKAKARGTEQIGVPLFDASTSSDGKGIDAQTLWNLMQTLNRSGIAGKTVLRGRLNGSTAPQAHQLADKSKALSDCHTCHREGSQAFQSVTISLVGPDGRRVGYGANADVLNSAFSVDSVSGFYAIGGTRIMLLDILLILAIFGGVRHRRRPRLPRLDVQALRLVSPAQRAWPIRRPAAMVPRRHDGARAVKGTAPCIDSTFTRCRSGSGTGPMPSASS